MAAVAILSPVSKIADVIMEGEFQHQQNTEDHQYHFKEVLEKTPHWLSVGSAV
jgi:hypothetical protein